MIFTRYAASTIAYLEEIKKNDINNATQMMLSNPASRLTGLDQIYEEGRRQVVFQNDKPSGPTNKQIE